jgi:hypothetical protein
LRCEEEKDRIFALLGMCSDRDIIEGAGFVPDYKLPWPEIYQSISRALLLRGHIDILAIKAKSGADIQCAEKPSLPSWTVNWCVSLQRPLCGFLEDRLFSASAGLPVNVATTGDPNALRLKGFFVNHLSDLGTLWERQDDFSYSMAHIFLQDIESFVGKSTAINSDQKEQAIYRIPIHDLEYSHLTQTQRATKASQTGFRQMKALAEKGSGPSWGQN